MLIDRFSYYILEEMVKKDFYHVCDSPLIFTAAMADLILELSSETKVVIVCEEKAKFLKSLDGVVVRRKGSRDDIKIFPPLSSLTGISCDVAIVCVDFPPIRSYVKAYAEWINQTLLFRITQNRLGNAIFVADNLETLGMLEEYLN